MTRDSCRTPKEEVTASEHCGRRRRSAVWRLRRGRGDAPSEPALKGSGNFPPCKPLKMPKTGKYSRFGFDAASGVMRSRPRAICGVGRRAPIDLVADFPG